MNFFQEDSSKSQLDYKLDIIQKILTSNYPDALVEINESLDEDIREHWVMFYLYNNIPDKFIEKYINGYTSFSAENKTRNNSLNDMVVFTLLKTDFLDKASALVLYDRLDNKNTFLGRMIKMFIYLKFDIFSSDFGDRQKILSRMADDIDDWRIYETAIDNNVDIYDRAKNSINMMWYNVIWKRDKFDCLRLMVRLRCFLEFIKLFEYVEYEWIEQREYQILYKYLKSGNEETSSYSDDEQVCDIRFLLDFIDGIIEENNNFFVFVKLLFGMLIATRKQNYLILVLFLCKKYSKQMKKCNELLLIQMFIYRYFCLDLKVIECMDGLDIKNIQRINFSYVIRDIQLVLRNDFSSCLYLDSSWIIEISKMKIIKMVESGSFESAKSCLNVIQKLKENVYVSESKGKRVLGNNSKTLFSYMLGLKCRFLFDKFTPDSSLAPELVDNTSVGTLFDIHYINKEEFLQNIDGLFKNSFCDINQEKKFIDEIKSLFISRKINSK